MNTQQLESFIQVAENLSFARAAEVLNITQSAVSRQIHSLEEELGTTLLRRSTRTVSLTPAGTLFLNDAKEIIGKLQRASLKLKSSSKSNVQIISMGCTSEAELPLLAQILQTCKENLPGIHPFLRTLQSRAILNLFIHGDIDLLFGFKDDIPMREGMRYKELAQIGICCVVPKKHPFSFKTEVARKELLSEDIVVCNAYEVPTRLANIQNSITHKIPPESTYFCETPQIMLTLIRAGYGIGLFPELLFDDTDITCIPLEGNVTMSYGVFYKDISKNPILKKVIALI